VLATRAILTKNVSRRWLLMPTPCVPSVSPQLLVNSTHMPSGDTCGRGESWNV
jgi:hypothetical protein